MSSEWSSHKIGDLFELVNGYAFKSADFIAAGVPVLKIKNVKPAKVVLDDLSYVSAEIASKRTDKEIKRGDILITMSGNRFDGSKETWVGKVAHFDIPGRYMLNQRVGVLRPRAGVEIDRKCAAYFLSSDDYQKLFISIATSSGGQANLSPAQILGEQLRLPSIDEQIQISEMLGALDDRIALLRETNATLEAIAQALFKSWFVDFDPVRAKQQGRPPESLDPATAALFPDDFEDTELGPVPKGWRVASLKDAVCIFDSKRIPLSGAERNIRKGGFPYYGAAALMDYVDDYLFDGIYLLIGEDGSVTDSEGFPVTQYVWGKIWVNNHAHVLQGNNGISTEHLMLAVKRINITPYVTGAVQAKLSQSNMWRIPFLMPSPEVSEAFGQTIAPLFAMVRQNTEQAQTLTSLRDTLLPRLISGQLRLPDVTSTDREAARFESPYPAELTLTKDNE